MIEVGSVVAPRVPWRPDFPTVSIHSDLRARDTHPAYGFAKSGSAEHALELARDLIDVDVLQTLSAAIDGQHPLLLPVTADEVLGFNAIPDGMASIIGQRLGLKVVAGKVVQTNKVGHTRAPAFQRLVTPATFDGPIDPGPYVLIDDHVGVGGTLASLRGHVESWGGTVIAMTTLTESRGGRQISLLPATWDALWDKHGIALDRYWHDQFGYGLDCLTDIEAAILCRQPSLVAIEDFLAKAAVEARGRGLSATIGSQEA